MSVRPEQPEPFLRGCVFPAVSNAPYPRADPAGAEYLPIDVWRAARLPVGVRLELVGNAKTIRVWYETSRFALGYRGESAGCAFVAYRAGQKVATMDALMGEGMAELVLAGRPDLPVTIYLPEGMSPLVTGVAGVEDTMVPAPLQPRWLAYGDAVTQGWLASAPAMAWPAVAGRKLGLDVCNLGYAGLARGESTSALMLSETPAEVISIAFGLNNWRRVPHTTALMAEEVRCFLSLVRKGHPETPIVVVSPTPRPDAENEPNQVGVTLAQLRTAMEQTVRAFIDDGDENLYLVEGLSVVEPDHLEDGVYPGDEGHRRLAAAVSKILTRLRPDLQTAAENRWAAEGISPLPIPIPPPLTPVSPAVLTPLPTLDGPTASRGSDLDGAGADHTADHGADHSADLDGDDVGADLGADLNGLPFALDDSVLDIDRSDLSFSHGSHSVSEHVFSEYADEPVSDEAASDPDQSGEVSEFLLFDGVVVEPTLPGMSSLGDPSPDEFSFDDVSSNGPSAQWDESSEGGFRAEEAYPDFDDGDAGHVDGFTGNDVHGDDLETRYAVRGYTEPDYGPLEYLEADIDGDEAGRKPAEDWYSENGDVDTDHIESRYFETDFATADDFETGYPEIGYSAAGYEVSDRPEHGPHHGVHLGISSATEMSNDDHTASGSQVTPVTQVTGNAGRATGDVISDRAPLNGRAVVDAEPDVETETGAHSQSQGAPESKVPSAPKPAEVKRRVRRDTAPVDIAVADMVVAALSLATNGADDVIYGREQLTEEDLHWVDAHDQGPSY